jgi:hypothetical protein
MEGGESKLANRNGEATPGAAESRLQCRWAEGGRLSAMTETRPQIQMGMAVVGSDGGPIGRVKEVGQSDFLLDRRLARDLYVPLETIREVLAGRVVLSINAEDTNYQNWPSSKLF